MRVALPSTESTRRCKGGPPRYRVQSERLTTSGLSPLHPIQFRCVSHQPCTASANKHQPQRSLHTVHKDGGCHLERTCANGMIRQAPLSVSDGKPDLADSSPLFHVSKPRDVLEQYIWDYGLQATAYLPQWTGFSCNSAAASCPSRKSVSSRFRQPHNALTGLSALSCAYGVPISKYQACGYPLSPLRAPIR